MKVKKNNFSKEDVMKKVKNFCKKLKKKYTMIFKNYPLLVFFVISVLFNSFLLRAITVHNFFYIKPLVMDLAMIFIISSLLSFVPPNGVWRITYPDGTSSDSSSTTV